MFRNLVFHCYSFLILKFNLFPFLAQTIVGIGISLDKFISLIFSFLKFSHQNAWPLGETPRILPKSHTLRLNNYN